MVEKRGKPSAATANFALINRGFFIFLAVSMGLLTLALMSFLWVSLIIVEDAVLERAKQQDLPFMADSLSKPLDPALDRLVNVAILVARNAPLPAQADGGTTLRPDEQQALQTMVENSLSHYSFDAAYIALRKSGEVRVYAADGSAYSRHLTPEQQQRFYPPPPYPSAVVPSHP